MSEAIKTGILGLTFKEDVSEDDIQVMISNFYEGNKDKISSVKFYEFADPSGLKDVYKFISKME